MQWYRIQAGGVDRFFNLGHVIGMDTHEPIPGNWFVRAYTTSQPVSGETFKTGFATQADAIEWISDLLPGL